MLKRTEKSLTRKIGKAEFEFIDLFKTKAKITLLNSELWYVG